MYVCMYYHFRYRVYPSLTMYCNLAAKKKGFYSIDTIHFCYILMINLAF